MKRIALFLILVLLISPAMLRAEEISLTLDQAVALALRDNRDILLKGQDLIKAKSNIAEANAGFFPSLTFTAGWTRSQDYYSKDISQISTQTTLKQYLYKGGKTINTIKSAEYGFVVTQTILDKTKLEIAYNVQKAFYTLLLANELAELNKGIVRNSEGHFNSIQARYRSGQSPQSDILRIESSLEGVKQASESAVNQIEAAQIVLRNLLYLDNEVKIKADAQFNLEPKEVAYEEGFLKAMKKRPEILQAEAEEEIARRSIEIAKSENRPNIYASWDYYSRSHVTATTGKNWNDYNIIGLTFTWPIFDGWATKAKLEQAIVDLKEAQLTREKTFKDIASEVKSAYLDLKDVVTKIKSIQAQVDLYKDVLKSNEEKYKQGEASSLDLDDASLAYKVALFNQKQAVYDYIIAKAAFDKATGGIK